MTAIQQRRTPVKRAFAGLVGLPHEPTESKPAGVMLSKPMDEENLRERLGVQKPEPKQNIPKSYRQLLNLDPEDIINFFDVQVGIVTEFAQVDFVVPPSMLEHRVHRLLKIIKRSKEIIDGLSVHVMKIRRGKDEVLDKPTREKFKREENQRMARSNLKLARYRAALRSGNYTEKILAWVTKPVLFSDVVDDRMCFETVTDVKWKETDKLFTGGLQTHNRVELFHYFRNGFADLEIYRAVMSLGVAALKELGETEAEQKDMWDNLRLWENAVIRAAVHHRIIRPRRDFAELIGLGSILDEDDNPIEADDTEDVLAIKTGGACYGGRIKGEGYRFRGGKIVQRALSSFDKPLRMIDSDHGHQDSGFGSLRDVNDDTESYDPRG